jgi:predicted HicB family RNase H-like nuclease
MQTESNVLQNWRQRSSPPQISFILNFYLRLSSSIDRAAAAAAAAASVVKVIFSSSSF